MSKSAMTPDEVIVYWYKKSLELEAQLKDSKDKLAQSEAANLKLITEIDDLEHKYIITELGYREEINKINSQIEYWKEKSVSYPNSMTYEQIIDLKCENAKLKEENTKFAKWQRILDKFKIF